jgi:hypothetical protein
LAGVRERGRDRERSTEGSKVVLTDGGKREGQRHRRESGWQDRIHCRIDEGRLGASRVE